MAIEREKKKKGSKGLGQSAVSFQTRVNIFHGNYT